MASKGGSGSRNADKRQAIIEGTQRLMLTAGYGAVTYRSAATEAEVTPGLVQYSSATLNACRRRAARVDRPPPCSPH